jgi:hypothetical protein|tara:strand:- start:1439 stop:1630 length:192 start_codon:yes stop_codon:yes gene_type:complete
MNDQFVTFDALKHLTGYKRDSDVSKCLTKQGIVCFAGRKGPWTTIGLIEQASELSITKKLAGE